MKKISRLLIASAAALTLVACGEYSDGERIGVIQKFSRKGLMSKTWEGDMLLGGLVKHTTTTSDSEGHTHSSVSLGANVWSFTVEDSALAAKVKQLMDSGTPVKVRYRQEYIDSPFRTETGIFGGYFLVSIEPVE